MSSGSAVSPELAAAPAAGAVPGVFSESAAGAVPGVFSESAAGPVDHMSLAVASHMLLALEDPEAMHQHLLARMEEVLASGPDPDMAEEESSTESMDSSNATPRAPFDVPPGQPCLLYTSPSPRDS